jgi:ATP-dependent Clp protease ATP-binding subunit ClpX
LEPLTIDDLVRILTEPRSALTKQYRALFERFGCDLRFSTGALRAIAEVGLERGGGARGLRGVLEELLLDPMFEVPASVSRLLTYQLTFSVGALRSHHRSSRPQTDSCTVLFPRSKDGVRARAPSG